MGSPLWKDGYKQKLLLPFNLATYSAFGAPICANEGYEPMIAPGPEFRSGKQTRSADSSLASKTKLNLEAECLPSSSVSKKESAARGALEASAGRPLSNLEWDQARSSLLDFVSILRAWHREGTTNAREFPEAA